MTESSGFLDHIASVLDGIAAEGLMKRERAGPRGGPRKT